MAESDSVPHFPPHVSPAQKQDGDTRQTEDCELHVSRRNDEQNSGDLWLDGAFFGGNSSGGHAEDREGVQEGVATGAAVDALPPSLDDDEDDVGSGGYAPQHQKLKRRRGSAGGGGGGGGGRGGGSKKNRKGRSSGRAQRGSDGQAGALGRHQLHGSRTRDKQS